MREITIATYNIRHGHDVDCDWDRIAQVITRAGADIVGFQEIDMHTRRVGGRDTVSGLVEATGLSYALFVPAMHFDGGQYGTAILSRYPIVAGEGLPLPSGLYEPRALGYVKITPDSGDPLYFLNTHLSYESRRQQDIQLSWIADWMEKNIPEGNGAVLTGDFNTEDLSAFTPIRDLGYGLVNDRSFKTFRDTGTAIDHILYRRSHMTLLASGMIDVGYSDHNLLWGRFRY